MPNVTQEARRTEIKVTGTLAFFFSCHQFAVSLSKDNPILMTFPIQNDKMTLKLTGVMIWLLLKGNEETAAASTPLFRVSGKEACDTTIK